MKYKLVKIKITLCTSSYLPNKDNKNIGLSCFGKVKLSASLFSTCSHRNKTFSMRD